MRTIQTLLICTLALCTTAKSDEPALHTNPSVLIGSWAVDMTPDDPADPIQAPLVFTTANKESFEGFFYRQASGMREARLTTRQGQLHGAFMTSDNSGDYHSSFRYQGGVLHGTTHSLARDFLSVWEARRQLPEPIAYQPRFVPSSDSLFEIKEDQVHTFGYLEVPENRSKPDTRTIRLPVYRFASRSKTPSEDPLIVLTGGPGESIMRNARWMEYWPYLDDRDLILFEQRGTEYAQPHLACPEWARAQSGAPGPYHSAHARAAVTCRDRLEAEGVDLSAYHTRAIAADVEDLRKAMGITRYNLLTHSYGGQIAQVLMRDFPDSIRSVVMDSPLPLQAHFDEDSLQNQLETLDLIFQSCQGDPACASAYPDQKSRLMRFLQAITDHPLLIELPSSDSEQGSTSRIRGKDVLGVLSNLKTAQLPELPAMVDVLLANPESVIAQWLSQPSSGSGAGMGMRLSVWCADESPFVSRAVIARERQRYPMIAGANPATINPEICDVWGVPASPQTEDQAIQSDIPTLIINGQFDPITPVKWGRQLNAGLSNSQHLVFNGFAHTPTTYWDNRCAMNAANAFFNAPDKRPQLECMQAIETFTFKSE